MAGTAVIAAHWRRVLRTLYRLAVAPWPWPGRHTPARRAGGFRPTRGPASALPAHGFDALTIEWGRRLLEHGDPRPPFPESDPVESAADAARLRGVFGYICELADQLPGEVVADRIGILLAWAGDPDRDPRVWWDTTNAALRSMNLLEGATALRRQGNHDLLERVLPRAYLRAHGAPLAFGRWIEPKGNHEAITALGRVALARLLFPDQCLAPRELDRLRSSLAGQFLPDGGHVERCPQYHLQVLAAIETVASASPSGVTANDLLPGHDLARSALGDMLFLSVPAPLGDLSRLWTGRDLRAAVDRLNATAVASSDSWLPHFGLATRRFETVSGGEVELVADLGVMGSLANPGHAHDDSLTYCIAFGGSPVVIDSGTYRYAPDPESVWFKLAGAHNVVSHGLDTRTPKGFYRWPASVVTEAVTPLRVRPRRLAAVRFGRPGSGILIHRRRWDVVPEGVRVTDRVRCGREGGGVSRVNLAPGVSPVPVRAGAVRLSRGDIALGEVRVRASHHHTLATVPGRIAPRYGALLPHHALEWRIDPSAREWWMETTFSFHGS